VTDTIVIHGLGYVGLTCAAHFAKSGVNVIGYDPDQSVVDAINAGKPKAGEFLGYLGDNIQGLPFRATTDFTEVCAHRIHIIAVPTEKDGEPWMLLVRRVVWTLLDVLPIGSLIIIESTLTPGTIDQLMKEYTGEHGCLVAHAPRRDWFADPEKNLATIPRVLGGFTPAATEAAAKVLEDVTPAELILQTDHRTAELVKPLENALFHLPIMLAHEMALIYPGHDVREAVRLASTHWRFASFGGLYLGMGSGGRCLAGHETVVSLDGNGPRIETIKSFVERWRPDVCYQVLSRSDEGYVFKTVTKVGVREAETLRLKSRGGHTITVTPDHQMFVRRKTPVRRTLIDGRKRTFPTWGEQAVAADSVKLETDHLVFFEGALPQLYDSYTFDLLDHAEGGCVTLVDGKHTILTGAGPTARATPRFVELDDDVAELLGLYAAEGWVSRETGTSRAGLAFHRDERNLIDFSLAVLRRLGLSPVDFGSRRWANWTVKVSNLPWAEMIANHVGTDSYEAWIPGPILVGRESWQRRFLRGVLMGDGCIEKNGSFTYYSASLALSQGVMLLLRRFGLKPTVSVDAWRETAIKYTISVAGDDARIFLRELLHGHKNIDRLAQTGRNNKWGRRARSAPNYPIVKESAPAAKQLVYSIDVEDTENFVTTGGLLVHNCVPLGPKYLVAGAEPTSAEEAFTDPKPFLLAAALDTEYEITRWTRRAISRAVGPTEVDRTTRVAILGVAYRPGFADLGFSPALRLAQQLCAVRPRWTINLHDAVATPAAVEAALRNHRLGNITGEQSDTFATPAELAVKLRDYDVIVVVTPHWAAYEDLGCDAGRVEYGTLPWRSGQIVFDARGIWSSYAARFAQQGVAYHQVGTPGWLG